MDDACIWQEVVKADRFSSVLPATYKIGCNGETVSGGGGGGRGRGSGGGIGGGGSGGGGSGGMLNGRPFSWCPFCGKEIESRDASTTDGGVE
jgi:hypothetical protein